MHPTGSTTDLRRHNRDMVLRAIVACGTASRTEIAQQVGLTNAAVSRITRELIAAGLIKEGERIALKGQAGRRKVLLEVTGSGAFVLGVAVTLNAKEIVLANGRGEIVARSDCSDISLADPRIALRAMGRRAKELIRRSGIDRSRLLGGAASVAGRVDPRDGRISGGDPLDWEGQRVAAELTRLIGIPFVAEGRAAALLLAERHQGQAKGLQDVLLINVGVKIGTALLIDGHLLRGASNAACQLARLEFAEAASLDELSSGAAVLLRVKRLRRARDDGDDPGTYLRYVAEDIAVRHKPTANIFRECGAVLGRAIGALTPVLAPQLVLLAGLVGRQPAYVEGFEAALAAANSSGAALKLGISRLTTVQSAVWLALDKHLYSHELDIERLMAA